MNKWISTKERLPELYEKVLVVNTFCGLNKNLAYLNENGEWVIGIDSYKITFITHWMPLPDYPEDLEEK